MTCNQMVEAGRKPFNFMAQCGGRIVTDGREGSPDFYYECVRCGATWSDGRQPWTT
jgi:DNA-directed RNA polymerase subunit RPC12/RpoP